MRSPEHGELIRGDADPGVGAERGPRPGVVNVIATTEPLLDLAHVVRQVLLLGDSGDQLGHRIAGGVGR